MRPVGDLLDDHATRQAERGGRLAQRVGHQPQHVLRRAHDDGDDDDRERQRAGERREMPHRRDHDLVDEQTDDDGGRAEQDVVDEADDEGERRSVPYSAR